MYITHISKGHIVIRNILLALIWPIGYAVYTAAEHTSVAHYSVWLCEMLYDILSLFA